MKVAILNVSSDLLLGKNSEKTIKILTKKFLELGVNVTKIITVENSPQSIAKELISIAENFIVVLGEESSVKNFNIKKAIASTANVSLIKDENCVKAITNYYKTANIPMLVESENEFFMPASSNAIIYEKSALIPFAINTSKSTIVFIPNNLNLVNFTFKSFIIPTVKDIYKINYKTITIKTFGIKEKDVNILIQEIIKNKYKILVETYSENQEVTILIRYNQQIDSYIIQTLVSKIYERLNKFIYADEDISIVTRAVDLLSVTKCTLAIAENCTAGRISEELSCCDGGLENLVYACVTPNKESISKHLNINIEILNKYGLASVETAYEMATALIDKTKSDVVVCTTGLNKIGDNSYQTFISVGDIDGIHVYKCSFSGDIEDVLTNISNTVFYYLIKKLKQNDLFFNQTTI